MSKAKPVKPIKTNTYIVVNYDGYGTREVHDGYGMSSLESAKGTAEDCLEYHDDDGSNGNVAEVYVRVGTLQHVKPSTEWTED